MQVSRWSSTLRGLMALSCAAALLTSCEDLEPCAKGGADLNETALAVQERLCQLGADIQAIPTTVAGQPVGADHFVSQNLAPSKDVGLSVTNIPGSLAADPAAPAPAPGALFPETPDIDVELPDGTQVTVPVEVAVTWTVMVRGQKLEQDRDMTVLGGGLEEPNLHIGIVPPLVSMIDSTTVQGLARAAVTLTADTSGVPGAGTPEVPVTVNPPPLKLPLEALRVPEVMVLFQDKTLTGRVLIVVPDRPELADLEGIVATLRKLEAAVPAGALQGSLAFLEFTGFLSGVTRLTGSLEKAEAEVAIAGDDDKEEIDNLNDIDLHFEPVITDLDLDFLNDIEAEDELSSLAYIGQEGDQVHLFNAQDQDGDEGQLEITLGRLPLAFVNDLHTDDPKLDSFTFPTPGSGGDARVVVVHEPDGRRRSYGGCLYCHAIETFGDELSSLAFR